MRQLISSRFSDDAQVESEVSYYVRLAIEELLLNLIDHTPLSDQDLAYIEVVVSKELIKLTIKDLGPHSIRWN
ncbi:hypothetical protein [Rubritalea tangerina]|uniref:hypothetical protein n=1 Tax=Rubritalea tangerina TaxID=430798 RepID=UPI003618C933